MAPTKSKVPMHSFTLQYDGFTIPGMRVFAGTVQPPMRRHQNAWYPTLYFPEWAARAIWEYLKERFPDLVLGPVEGSIQAMCLSDYSVRRMNLLAEARETR